MWWFSKYELLVLTVLSIDCLSPSSLRFSTERRRHRRLSWKWFAGTTGRRTRWKMKLLNPIQWEGINASGVKGERSVSLRIKHRNRLLVRSILCCLITLFSGVCPHLETLKSSQIIGSVQSMAHEIVNGSEPEMSSGPLDNQAPPIPGSILTNFQGTLPAIDPDGRLYFFSSFFEKLKSMDPGAGSTRWSISEGFSTYSPSVSVGILFSENLAVNVSDGTRRWRSEATPAGGHWVSVTHDGVAVFVSSETGVRGVEVSTGKSLWRFLPTGRVVTPVSIGVNGNVFLVLMLDYYTP